MTRGVGTPTYITYDPIWAEGDPVRVDYPLGYRTLVSLFASPSYHPATMIMQVMDNEEYANSPPAVGRRSVSTGNWEQTVGLVNKVGLINYGDGVGAFIFDDFMPPIVWPPTSSKLYTVRYKSQFSGGPADFWWVEMDADYPFTFSKRSPTPNDKGDTADWNDCWSLSYNSAASMLVAMHSNYEGGTAHTKFSMWAPGPNVVSYFRSSDGAFSGRYTTSTNAIPQGFLIDKHDHLWVFTFGQVDVTENFYLDEYSWAVGAGDIVLTHLNRYNLINQDGGFNTWQYSIFGATYNEDLDEFVFYWTCRFPSVTHTNRDPVDAHGGAGHWRITHWDLATRSKKLSGADSILITKESDGLLLTTFGSSAEEPDDAEESGVPGFIGSQMNADGDHFIGTWTKQDWTAWVCANPVDTITADHDGFFYIDINTGVATKYDDWPGDLYDDTASPTDPGVYTWAGAIYEPINEKFWAGRRNQGFEAHFVGTAWYYETEGFGIYGWDSPPEETCPPCEEPEPCCDVADPEVDCEWPFNLQPTNVGIHRVPVSLQGINDFRGTSSGFWELRYEGVRLRSRQDILDWKAIEACLTGRSGVLRAHIYDGKRAPWAGAPGGVILVEAATTFAVGATAGSIRSVISGPIYAGMHFSYNDRLYILDTVDGPVADVYAVTIFPEIREEIPASDLLEFGRPTLRCRLKDPDGMDLTLEFLRLGTGSFDLQEDI